MRRYVLYLAVGLLAFGISSLITINFYWNHSPKVVEKERPAEIKSIEQKISDETVEKFVCEDEAAKAVWEKLKKDDDFTKWVDSYIETHNMSNCQWLFERYDIDLNNDKSDEAVLTGTRPYFCGSSGDCRTWIVAKIKNEYRIILDVYAGEFDYSESSEGLEFLPEKTNKYKNIKVRTYHGWSADNFGIFKFDGKQYRIKKCFEDVNSEYEYNDVREEKWIPVKSEECL